MQTYKIAMIGDPSTVAGFGAGGVHGFSPQEEAADSTLDLLGELIDAGEYAIIFITEALAEPVLDQISRLHTGAIPAVIVIPDHTGARGVGFEKIRGAVERAIGIDLLGSE